jgi:SNF2 family DNA or RNA helicase
MQRAYNPRASYSDLKRVEMFIAQSETVEDLRYIAATEGSTIGYKALGRLLAGTITAAEMKPKEAETVAAQQVQTHQENIADPFMAKVEGLLYLDSFFPSGKKPYAYQIDGIRFLVCNEGALLGDAMGLGKTIEAIGALKVLHWLEQVKHALILCPRPLVGQWEHELRAWAPELFVQKVRGDQLKRSRLWRSGATVHIASYEMWRTDVEQFGDLSQQYQLVILDEVQKIKEPKTAINMAVGRLKAKYRWGLSGTPLENRLDDVVTIFNFLCPALFRKIEAPYQPSIVKRLMGPHFLRRRLSELQLPDKIYKEIWLDLTDEQHSSYKIIEEQSRQRLSQPETKRMHVFAAITRLKQICSYDADSGTSCKLDYLAEELENIIANNQKALVFSHFPQVTLKPISKELQQFSPAIYDGTLTDSQGEKLLKAFQNEPTPRVLLTSIRAGGVGLNLMRASQVFHLDHWWNPAIARQAEARAHRHGQSETVIVHRIFTKGTIEERIYQLLQEKQSLFDMVIDDLTEEQIKGALSLEELFGLFDLEAPTPRDKRPVKKRSGYTPVAPYSALKQVEDKLNRAESIEEVRRVAQLECSRIGYKAFCYLLGELATPEMMKGK